MEVGCLYVCSVVASYGQQRRQIRAEKTGSGNRLGYLWLHASRWRAVDQGTQMQGWATVLSLACKRLVRYSTDFRLQRFNNESLSSRIMMTRTKPMKVVQCPKRRRDAYQNSTLSSRFLLLFNNLEREIYACPPHRLYPSTPLSFASNFSPRPCE